MQWTRTPARPCSNDPSPPSDSMDGCNQRHTYKKPRGPWRFVTAPLVSGGAPVTAARPARAPAPGAARPPPGRAPRGGGAAAAGGAAAPPPPPAGGGGGGGGG